MAFTDVMQGVLADAPPPAKILVVDDDAEDIYLLRRLLRRSNVLAYEVFACQDLDEGAAVAATETIDLLLVDFFLGLDISIDRGRPGHTLLSLPFILLSGLYSPDLAEAAREAGAIGFLYKGNLTVEAVDALTLQVLRAPKRRAGLATVALDACVPLPDS